RPLTGFGPGALSLVSPEYGTSVQYPVVYQVHDTPLQLYAETGIVGVLGCLALLWGLIAAYRKTSDAGRSSRELGLGGIRDAAATAAVSYAFFALTDYQLDVPVIVLLAAIPAG